MGGKVYEDLNSWAYIRTIHTLKKKKKKNPISFSFSFSSHFEGTDTGANFDTSALKEKERRKKS